MPEETLEEIAIEIEKDCMYNSICKERKIPRDICPIFRNKLNEILKNDFENKHGLRKLIIIQ